MAEKKITRRSFVKELTLTCACSSVYCTLLTPRQAAGRQQQQAPSRQVPLMEYRVLGRTGLKVSALSFGVMRLSEPAVLFDALDRGINYFDTAHVYQNGNNETMLGNVLKQYGRQKVMVATKIPPFRRLLKKKLLDDTATMEKKMEESLRRLQTDYVDVLFLHAISDPVWAADERMLEFCRSMKRAGKARFVGISFHEAGRPYVDIVDRALETDFYDVFLATINFKSLPNHIDALRRARSKNIGIVAMKTQAGGYAEKAAAALSPHQAALKWVLDQPFVDCAVPGMVNREQLAENAGVIGKKMTWSDRKTLHAYYEEVKDRLCLRCGACLPSCPACVDIPSVNRALMYWEGYRDVELARSAYREIPASQRAGACLSCPAPACRCANGLNLKERMRVAHEFFVRA